MSFVRQDIASKLVNVSNRGNLQGKGLRCCTVGSASQGLRCALSTVGVERFCQQFTAWRPGAPIIHPHSFFKAHASCYLPSGQSL